MDKQKQIDISKVKSPEIRKRLEICEMENHINRGFDIAYKMQTSNFPNSIAETLYDAGYRKIPEGGVVLTNEEYKRYERIEKIIKLAKMEKANGYEVKNGKLYYFSNMLGGCEIEFKDLQEICDMANHYNEEFWGLDQRLTFWKGKAETARKETTEKFAEKLKEIARDKLELYGWQMVDIDDIDEICKEITEGKV